MVAGASMMFTPPAIAAVVSLSIRPCRHEQLFRASLGCCPPLFVSEKVLSGISTRAHAGIQMSVALQKLWNSEDDSPTMHTSMLINKKPVL